MELERAGLPCYLVTTTLFVPLVEAEARAVKFGEVRMIVLEHPLAGLSADELRSRGEEAAGIVLSGDGKFGKR